MSTNILNLFLKILIPLIIVKFCLTKITKYYDKFKNFIETNWIKIKRAPRIFVIAKKVLYLCLVLFFF